MMKALLELVKFSRKNKYVTYFYQLDAVGKTELPCVKAIQESYASKVRTPLDVDRQHRNMVRICLKSTHAALVRTPSLSHS